MPVTLQVEFKGLCAFAERKDADVIYALLPNVAAGHGGGQGGHAHGHHGGHGDHKLPPHTALLVTQLDEVERESARPDIVIAVPGDTKYACWKIDGSDIDIDYSQVASKDPITLPGSIVLRGDPKAPDAPQQVAEWSDRAWLPDLERVLGNKEAATANPACFGKARPPFVSARLPLRHGVLQCMKPVNEVAGQIPYHFAADNGPIPGINQVFSDRVLYRVEVNATQVRITVRNAQGPRVIRLHDGITDGVIRTVLCHLPDTQNVPVERPDEHFVAYYDLLGGDVMPMERRPIPHTSGKPTGGGTTVDCYGCRIGLPPQL